MKNLENIRTPVMFKIPASLNTFVIKLFILIQLVSKLQKVFQGFKTSYGVQFVKFGLAGVQASVLLNTPEQFITFKTSHPDLFQIHK